MTTCGALGALIVGGRVVGQVKCDLPVGHDEHAIVRIGHEIPGGFRTPGDWATSIDRHYPPSPHAMTMTWNPEEDVDMDLFDPDEHFDVEIPILSNYPLTCIECGNVVVAVGTPASGPKYVHAWAADHAARVD